MEDARPPPLKAKPPGPKCFCKKTRAKILGPMSGASQGFNQKIVHSAVAKIWNIFRLATVQYTLHLLLRAGLLWTLELMENCANPKLIGEDQLWVRNLGHWLTPWLASQVTGGPVLMMLQTNPKSCFKPVNTNENERKNTGHTKSRKPFSTLEYMLECNWWVLRGLALRGRWERVWINIPQFAGTLG